MENKSRRVKVVGFKSCWKFMNRTIFKSPHTGRWCIVVGEHSEWCATLADDFGTLKEAEKFVRKTKLDW